MTESIPILSNIKPLLKHTVPEPETIWAIVTLRNAEKWLNTCLDSILNQTCVRKIKIGICDDNSSDNSPNIIEEYKRKYTSQIFFTKNTERKYKLRNVMHLLSVCPIQDTDVVCFIDGDDWLAEKNSLQIVLDKYSTTGCWVTYGTYKQADGTYNTCCREMTEAEKAANNFRGSQWIFSHLFTFRYFLWKSIPPSYFIRKNEFEYQYASDVIINMAILDIAKSSRTEYIRERIYMYNNLSDINDFRVNPKLQETADILNRQIQLSTKEIFAAYDYTIIIPYRKRKENLIHTYESIKESIKNTNKKINIIVSETSEEAEAEDFCKQNNIEYLYFPMSKNGDVRFEYFNKSLSFDVAVMWGLPSNGYICHDVDVMILPDFWIRLEANLKGQNVEALQTYTNRFIWCLNKEATEDLHSGKRDFKSMSMNDCVPPAPGSWGGSIYISRRLYFQIGGYDPDLYYGYSPEDQAIVFKIQLFTNIGFANDPPINLYHQWHVPTCNSNPLLNNMTHMFYSMKQHTKGTLEYIESKSKHMKEC